MAIPVKKMTKLNLSTIPFLPMGGRGIDEDVDWMQHGDAYWDANGDGFVATIPGEDKMVLTYTGSGDWAAPAFMHIPLLSEVEVTLIDPWYVPFAAGQTSVVLPRASSSADTMRLFLEDKADVPDAQWTLASPKVVTLTAQTKAGFVSFHPTSIFFLMSKPKSRGEWTGKVNWTVGFKEK